MEILAKRVSCMVEHEPLHPPISQKMHLQPDLTFRHFNYTASIIENFCCNGGLVNRRSQGPVLPVSEGSVVKVTTVVKPSSPAVGMVLQGVLNTVYAPFERVKLLMQNQNAIIKSGRLLKPYNGIFDCFASTIRNEGIFSLWRGNIALTTGFLSYQVIRSEILKYALSRDVNEWSGMRVLVFCCVSKAAIYLLVYPFSYAGTRMAADVKTITGSNMGSRQFNGTLDVFRKTLKSDGIAGLYRGYSSIFAEIWMLGPSSMGLKLWELSILEQFQSNDLSRHVLEFGFNIFGRMASYPFDTVSRRMMMTSGAVKYKSAGHAVSQIWKTEGWKSFYSGLGTEILECVLCPKNVIALLTIFVALQAARAAKKKADDDEGSPFTFSVRWKREK